MQSYAHREAVGNRSVRICYKWAETGSNYIHVGRIPNCRICGFGQTEKTGKESSNTNIKSVVLLNFMKAQQFDVLFRTFLIGI